MSGADVRANPHLFHLRPAKRYPFRGKWMRISDISDLTGIPYQTIYNRLKAGKPADQSQRCGPKPKLFLFRGLTVSVKEASEISGISCDTLRTRICGDRILECDQIEPAYQTLEDWGDRIRIITYRGKSNSIAGWSRETGIPYGTLFNRLTNGWSVKDVLTRPIQTKPKVHNPIIIQNISAAFRRERARRLCARIAIALRRPALRMQEWPI